MSRRGLARSVTGQDQVGRALYGTDVSPLAIVLAVIAFILAAAVASLLRGLSTNKKQRGRLEEQLVEERTKLSELETRAAELGVELASERSRADSENQRATAAEEAAREASKRAGDAEEKTRTIESELRRDLGDPAHLGALEALRISRLWQEHVPGPGEPLPVETHDDVHAALVVLAEASREESGTTVDISWLAEEAIGPAQALQIVRIAEELMASARNADSLDIIVTSNNGTITVTALTEPETPLTGHLKEVLDTTGWVTKFGSGEVILSL